MLVVACAGSETEGPSLDGSTDPTEAAAPVVRDSAGVGIVTSAPDFLESPNWRVDSLPLVTVDGTEGGLEPFHRIASAAFDTDSTFLLGEMAMTRLRRYSMEGRLLQTVGFPGQGPGEFGAMNDLVSLGDSLVVWDSRWRRATVFDETFTYVRSIRLTESRWGLAGTWLGLADGGHPIVLVGSGVETNSHPVVYDRDGTDLRRLEAVPGHRRWPPGVPREESPIGAPFRAIPRARAIGPHIVWFGGEDYRVDRFDLEGRLVRSDRIGTRPRPLTPEMVARWRASGRETAQRRDRPAEWLRAFEAYDPPDALPSLGMSRNAGGPPRMFGDDLGRTWVVEWPGQGLQRWVVFDQDGALAGVVRLPLRFELEAVRGHLLAGVQTDELGVESLAIYRLRLEE